MYPVLFHVAGYAVPSYSVMMVLGYALALLVVLKVTPGTAQRSGGLSRGQVWDLYIVMVVSSVIASKIGHVLFEAPGHKDEAGQPIHSVWELLKADPWHWARLGEPGFVWYGGMIGALLTAIYYFRKRPALDAWLYADAFAPAIMMGDAVGRIGCFLAGCCHGKPSDLPWAMIFTTTKVPVHPTQLYESLAAGTITAFLAWRFSRRRFDGENIAILLMAYALIRSTIEVFRGDMERGTYGPFSTSQLLSVPLFAAGLGIYLWRSRRAAPPVGDAVSGAS